MKRFKHYSFDLWLTLIKSNPEFKQERAQYFYEQFNPTLMSLNSVQDIITEIDITCNLVNEKVGKNIDALSMYTMVLLELGNSQDKFDLSDVLRIYDVCEKLFLKYPPTIFADTVDVLAELKTTSTLSILSNTGFIKGSTLQKYLETTPLADLFLLKWFSDEIGLSKPNPSLYREYINSIKMFTGAGAQPQEILHVGDNLVADIKGAQQAGISAFQINTNDKTIQHLLFLTAQ